MADERINFIATFDDADVAEAMERVSSLVASTQSQFDDLGETGSKEFQEIGKSIEALEKALLKYAKAQEEEKKKTEESDKAMKKFRDTMSQTIRNTNIFGINIGKAIDRLKNVRDGLKATQSGLRGVSGGFRLLKAAIVSTGIGAVVIIVGSLIAAFTKLQPVMDRIRVITAQVGTAVGVLTDKLAKIGGLIIDVLGGQKSLSEAWNEGKEELSELNEEMAEAIRFAGEYERLQISLERQTSLVNTQIALQRAEIKRLNLEAEDTTNSFEKRADAARKAGEIEKDLLNQQVSLLKQKIGAELGALEVTEDNNKAIEFQIELLRQGKATFEGLRQTLTALTPTIANEDDVNTLLGLVQELGAFQSQSLEQQTTLNNKLNIIEAERIRRIQERLKAIQELQDTIAETDAILGGPAEVARRQYDLALRQIEKLKKEARSLGLELDFSGVERIAEAQFERAKDAALGELEGIQTGLEDIGEMTGEVISSLFPERDLHEEGLAAGKAIAEAFAQGFEGASDETIGEIITEKLQRAFDLNDAQLQFIAGSVGMIFESVIVGIDATTQAAIAQQDEIIAATEERINETQRLLDIEEERKRNGYANDVTLLRERLEKEQEEREKAEQARLELEKRAARQRLIQNSIEQASNFVLAVTKLTAQEAGKGIIGIFTALAGVALIARIVAQAKATQFEVPQLREGTPYLQGPSHENGGILIEAEGGERFLSRALNARVGGSQVSNDELVRLFEVGKLVESANRSPLPGAVAEARRDQRRLEELKVNLPFEIMQKAYQDAANKAADKMISYWKSRPVEKPDGNGGKVVEWKEGGRIERHKVVKQ